MAFLKGDTTKKNTEQKRPIHANPFFFSAGDVSRGAWRNGCFHRLLLESKNKKKSLKPL